MAADKMKEILKHFPDLEDGWKEMEEKKIIEPAEREMLSLKYREKFEREILKENLPEPEFTKAKRAEATSKVSSKVSEDLEEAIGEYCSNPDNFISYVDTGFAYRSEQKDDIPLIIKAIKFGANWQKQQMMAKAVDATVHIDTGGYPYIPQMELYDYDKDIPLAKEGEKVKVIVIKED